MASVSSATSSLGNTALRGFGGMASGIDRDSIIEQMTLGTNTKIANKKKEITNLEWKQEAYRDVIDKIINMEDKYYTYSSTESLLNRSFFSKNLITALGDSSVTKYISATGSSSMLDYVSILGVKQMATSANLKSENKQAAASITTGITADNILKEDAVETSSLAGKTLEFGSYNTDGKWNSKGSFTFPSTYTEVVNGEKVTKTIDYTDTEHLAENLNKALKSSDVEINGQKISEAIEFGMTTDGKIQITDKSGLKGNVGIRETSSALASLGFVKKGDADKTFGITLETFNQNVDKTLEESSITKMSMADYMKGKKVSVTFAGQTKEIELITAAELEDIKNNSSNGQEALNKIQSNIQSRLNKAFGTNNVAVDAGTGTLEFKLGSGSTSDPTKGDVPTLTVTNSSAAVRNTLGIKAGASNKVSLDSSLYDNREMLGFSKGLTEERYNALKTEYDDLAAKYQAWADEQQAAGKDLADIKEADMPADVRAFKELQSKLASMGLEDIAKSDGGNGWSLKSYGEVQALKLSDDKMDSLNKVSFEQELKKMSINGVTGADLKVTADTTVNQFMNALNKNADAGVKATFLSATNQFVLIATETGSGREINVGGAAKTIFGDTSNGAVFTKGQNAQMTVSYGNGIETTVESSTNTFNLDGMNVTVSGTFGYKKDAAGNVTDEIDRTQAVNFSAKADVDAATERVKKFIEEYNALVSKVDKEMSTRPDSDYGPLTDEQKDEMDDTSIENWEKKAKEGILFGDSNLRGLSDELQTVVVSLINSGINTNDLESIGISMGGMYEEGGKLNFDEAKFREAMNNDPDKVADIICGGGDVKTGLAETIGNKLSSYATRFGWKHNGSNGCLVEVAGTEKISNSMTKNQIYNQLKEMQEAIEKLKSALTVEQDRYIKQFTTMEQMISQMNSQSSYFASLSAG